eukprot:SAG31_NODE_12835_length_913_cov_1.576167_1_plen_20_part_10
MLIDLNLVMIYQVYSDTLYI